MHHGNFNFSVKSDNKGTARRHPNTLQEGARAEKAGLVATNYRNHADLAQGTGLTF